MSSAPKFPFGIFAGNPNGNNSSAETTFEKQFNSFVATMGARPQFMDGFVDPNQDPSQWASNASWTAWSWASSPVVGTRIIPVIGVPMADNNSWNNQDQFFQGIVSGEYDADYKGIVDAWAKNGYHTVYFRPGYEMDGSYMSWFMGNDAHTQADWVTAFQHLSTLMKQEGQTDGINVKIVWNPSDASWTSADVASLYPGDQYVDVIGTDVYSPQYPLDLTNWAAGGTTQNTTFAQWSASAINRQHYWTYPSANYWNPKGQAGVGWSVQDTINLALAHHKPIGIAETGAGGDGTTNGPVDDPAFPAWLAAELAQAGAPQVAFVNIWDVAMSDGNWDFTSAAANKPKEAAAWAKYFGAGSGTPSITNGGTVGTGTDKLVLKISEDRYANGDGTSDANGDATFVVLVDGKQIGGTLTATAMHSQGQTEQFTVLGNFGTGTHVVEVRLTNNAWSGVSTPTTDRNIYVTGVTYDGATVAYTGTDWNGGGAWFTVGSATASVNAAASASVVASTPESAALFVSPGQTVLTTQPGDIAVSGSGVETVFATSGVLAFGGPSGSQLTFISGDSGSTVVGGSGKLVVIGSAKAADVVFGGSGKTEYFGGAGGGIFVGGSGSDLVYSGSGASTIFGGSGGGIYVGARGDTEIIAGAGASTVVAADGNTVLLTGAAGNAVVAGSGNETLMGSGSSGNNTFLAGSGADQIIGGPGHDVFVAGTGSATITGDAGGLYAFVEGKVGGTDLITNFKVGTGHVSLQGYGHGAPSAALRTAQVSGGSTTIALPDGTHITFQGMTDLSRSSFV